MNSSYETLLQKILTEGERVQTGATIESEGRQPYTLALTGQQFVHDLNTGFPAVTTKKLQWGSVVKELLWFLRGDTNIKTLGCGIWNQWQDSSGDCGPIYGEQWRRWVYRERPAVQAQTENTPYMIKMPTITRPAQWDQVGEVVKGLKAVVANPFDRARRRLVVSAWNAPVVPLMGLAPCHTLWQVLPVNGRLDMICHWRSIDMLLGFPFNVASYALLAHILCEITGLRPGWLKATIADCHIYDNQVEAVKEQIARTPFPYPILEIDPRVKELVSDLSVEQCRLLTPDMFTLRNYRHRGKLLNAPEIAV